MKSPPTLLDVSHPNMDSSEEALSEGTRSDSICLPSSRAVKMRLQTNKSFFLDLFYQSSLLVIDVIEWIAPPTKY